MGTDRADADVDRVRNLIDGGAEIAGASAGAAIGLIAGPPGALGGAVVGVAMTRTLRRVGSDLAGRVLGPRQRERVGAAAAFAIAEIRTRLEAGDQPRDDDFFQERGGQRPAAEELLEGVLLAAQDSFEEAKLRYLARIFSSVAFDPTFSRHETNHLLQIAEALTYRQYVLLLMLRDGDDMWRSRLPQENNRSRQQLLSGPIAVLSECLDLYQRGLIVHEGGLWLGLTDVIPGQATTIGMGSRLIQAMGLDGIPEADCEAVLVAATP